MILILRLSKQCSVNGGNLYYNLSGKYATLTGKVAYDDSDHPSGNGPVEIYVDGFLAKRINFTGKDLLKSFSADIINCSELRIYVGWGHIDLIDFMIK